MTTRTTASKTKRSKAAVTKKKATRKKTAKKAAASARKPAGKKASAKKTTRKKAAPKKTATTAKATRRSTSHVVSGPGLGEVYQPARNEEYMSDEQLEHFRQKLLSWKDEIQRDLLDTMNHLREDVTHLADPNDRATQESEFALELRTRDRERKLLRKIDAALSRIKDGSYGYCEETGEEIGLARLEIRPVATLCVEAQEQRERRERQFADER